jgi:hypothetical protein
MELLETPGMAGAYFHLQRPDVIPDETVSVEPSSRQVLVLR